MMMLDEVQLPPTRRPVILPVVASLQHREGAYPAVLAPQLASELAQRVALARLAQRDEPITVNELAQRLAYHIHRGAKVLLLLPWCLQETAVDLFAGASSALQQTGASQVDLITFARPMVAVHGVVSMGPMGGFIPVQQRFDRLVALVPGWHIVYTCVQSEQVTILVPHALSSQSCCHSGSGLAAQLEMGLCAAMWPAHVHSRTSLLDERPCEWVQDGAIYAAYLVQLLCGALDSACARSLSSVRLAATSSASA